MRARELEALTRRALGQVVGWLDGLPLADEGLEGLAKRYADAKAKLGRQTIAGRLGLGEADLAAFDTALRDMVRRMVRLPAEPNAIEDRNALIAELRVLGWLEFFDAKAQDLSLDLTLPGESSEETGRKQVRALELILRSLVDERYQDQEKLIARLKELLSEKVVQQWMASADKGDVLSGTSFSDLASLFVSQQEFPSYEPLYKATPFLTLLQEKRVTIRHYLDDIRRIRNVLAHNKRVTPLQIRLLALYYEELVEPIQEAFDQGRTKVNPDLYLDASEAELSSYFGKIKDDIKGVRDDLAELRADLVGRLEGLAADTGEIKQQAAAIKRDTGATKNRTQLILVGVLLLVVAAGGTFFLLKDTKETTEQIAQTTEETQQTAEQTQQTAQETQQQVGEVQEQQQETQQTLEDMQQTAEATELAIEQMAEGLKQLANTGGLVNEPKTPAEFYHNARLLAQRGEIDRAIENYKELFKFPIPYADPVIDLVALLKAKYGEYGAAAALPSVFTADSDPRIVEFATILAKGEDVMVAAVRLLDQADPYLPTLWAVAEGLMQLPYQEFSFGLRKIALANMQRIKAALADGSLARLYLDQIRVDAIRGQLAGYERQFPAGAAEAFDQPLAVDWEQYDWIDGEAKLRVMFMWNPAAAARNSLQPPELWVKFFGLRPPFDQPFNLLDPDTAAKAQRDSYPPDMEVPPELDKMVRDLAAQQNPMATQLMLPQPQAPIVKALVKFTETGGIGRTFCLSIPNDNGAGYVAYLDLKECSGP